MGNYLGLFFFQDGDSLSSTRPSVLEIMYLRFNSTAL